MNYAKFPYSFWQDLNKSTEEKVKQITKQRDVAINKIIRSLDNSISNLKISRFNDNETNYGTYFWSGFGIGLLVGFFACFTFGNQIDEALHFTDSLASAFMLWLMFGVIGAFALLILRIIVVTIKRGNNVRIENDIEIEKQRAKERIAIENKKCDEAIQAVRNNAKKQYYTYLNGFDSEAQKFSVHFAESPLAEEVIEWMTSGFVKTINAADRRSHVDELNIPFVFKTYRNKIECNLGVFDFEIKRCDELNSPLEQTAQTTAIASAIQLNITMKYPHDASGTNIVTEISYEYQHDHVTATVLYTAPNGNYRSTRSWAAD